MSEVNITAYLINTLQSCNDSNDKQFQTGLCFLRLLLCSHYKQQQQLKKMEDIKEIFDKKSPLFIITIAIFITAIVARGQPFSDSCTYSQQLKMFETCLIITTGAALLLKTVIIQLVKKCCGSRISLLHNLIVFGLLFLDIGIYVWSLYLYISIERIEQCVNNQPHHFLVQVYSVLYSLLFAVILMMIASVRLENKTMTVLEHHHLKQDESS